MQTGDIHIRDPFVLPYNGIYYLYGTRGSTAWGMANGFDVYCSTDLENWDGPYAVFENDGSFWADRHYWAPEVHQWHDRFYMFASFKNETVHRGTAVLVADTPRGPFAPLSNGPVTPRKWECLDGTFYVSRDEKPYMVFCHEWVQAGDGEILAMPLTDDLSAPDGEPRLLFKASEAPWCTQVTHSSGVKGFVTDGPFFWRTGSGNLICLWASFHNNDYTEGMAVSDNGEISGRFVQAAPLFEKDGGHAMVFRAFDGRIIMTLHSPNNHPFERPFFIECIEKDGLLARK